MDSCLIYLYICVLLRIRDRKMYYPLSDTQMGMFMECSRHPDTLQYNLSYLISFSVDCNAGLFINALKDSLCHHSNFWLRLTYQNGVIRQYEDRTEQLEIEEYTIAEERLEEYLTSLIKPFPLFGSKLMRLAHIKTEHLEYCLLETHHLVSDGITLSLVLDEASDRFLGKTIPEETCRYVDFSEDESGNNAVWKESEALFYKKKFKNFQFRSLNGLFQSDNDGKNILIPIFFDRKEIDSFCNEHGLKSHWLFYAAFSLALSTWMHSNEVCFSTIFHGRTDRRMLSVLGPFIKNVPMLIRINPESSVMDYIMSFRKEMVSMIRHSNYSVFSFCNDFGFIPDVLFAYQSGMVKEFISLENSGTLSQIKHQVKSDSVYSGVVYESDDQYEIRIECSSSTMTKTAVECTAASIRCCIESLMSNINGKVADVSSWNIALPEAQPANVSFDTVMSAISRRVTEMPSKTAVSAEDRSLTYAQLEEESDYLAGVLKEAGLECGQSVLVKADRNSGFMVKILAVMKAGGCAVPVERNIPEERLRYIVDNSGAMLCLDGDNVLRASGNGKIVDAAYIIYTSGSTGKPKGVMVSHRAFASFVMSIADVLSISADDRISCHSELCFDACLEDLFPALTKGGSVYLVPGSLRKDPKGLVNYLIHNKITGGNYTTRFGTILLREFDLPLRYLVLGGESMNEYPERNRNVTLVNTYGPTEFTVDATFHILDPNREYGHIPIGKPLPGVSAYILDQNLNPVPPMVVGELCLSGDQIADGYVDMMNETDDSFVDWRGRKIYRTGDLVYLGDDDNLYFCGRMDGQCKLRGFRIETGEIENAVKNLCKSICEAAVVIKKVGDSDHLCCYYTSDDSVDENDLKSRLVRLIPQYMVPSFFVRMDSLPYNYSGKLDLKSLPDITFANTNRVLPENERESTLYRIAADLLGRDDFGVTDDLFSLGLTSLQLIQLIMKAEKDGLELKPSDVYLARDIRAIAKANHSPFFICGDESSGQLAVIVCGVTAIGDLEELIKLLSESMRVMVFEPLEDHIDTFSPESVDDIAKFYIPMIQGKPDILIGHSFGGEIALKMASKLDGNPKLFLLDSQVKIRKINSTAGLEKKARAKGMKDDVIEYWKIFLEKSKLAYRFHNPDNFDCGFDGESILFNAVDNMMGSKGSDNVNLMKKALSEIKVIDINSNHMGMLRSENIIRICDEIRSIMLQNSL